MLNYSFKEPAQIQQNEDYFVLLSYNMNLKQRATSVSELVTVTSWEYK